MGSPANGGADWRQAFGCDKVEPLTLPKLNQTIQIRRAVSRQGFERQNSTLRPRLCEMFWESRIPPFIGDRALHATHIYQTINGIGWMTGEVVGY
jgi:hypothetical protein